MTLHVRLQDSCAGGTRVGASNEAVSSIPAARGARRAARRQRARAGAGEPARARRRGCARRSPPRRRGSPTRAKGWPTPSGGSRCSTRGRDKRRQQLDDTQDKLVQTRVRLTRLERKQAKRREAAGREPALALHGRRADVHDRRAQRRRVQRPDHALRVPAPDRAPQRLRARRHARRADQGQGHDERPQGAAREVQRAGARRRGRRQPRGRDPHRAAQPRAASSCAGATAPRPSSRACAAGSRRSSAARPRRRGGRRWRPRPPTRRRGTSRARAAAAGTSSGAWSRRRARSPRRPYVWGGGHGGSSGGYDCSGSISYALAAAGLLNGSLDSTGFMSWGEAGPGRRITVYANAGHAFMVVDGRRYDTSALSGGGTRWSSSMRSTAGFVARHPPGL